MVERIIILLCVNTLFYARTLRYRYVSDDIPAHKNIPKFKHKWHKWFLEFTGNAKVTEIRDHLMTMFIHAAVCVFIYIGFGRNDISFLAALLFMINPVNGQVSVWISGRGYSLPALALVLSVSFPFLAPLFLYGGCWFTAGYPAPFVFLFSPLWWITLSIPFIWYLHYRKFKSSVLVKFAAESYGEDKRVSPRKIILAFKTYGFYLALCLVPFRITFYHSFLQSCSGNEIMRKKAYSLDKFFWIGVGGASASILAAVWRLQPITWGLWWFAIAIMPYCNIKRINQEIAERFAYIPNIGLMVALAAVAVNYPVFSAVMLTMYALRTWYIMPMYTDEYWLTEYAIIEDPYAWFAWHMRAVKRWDQGSFREALNMWVMAKLISPKEFKILINIAFVLHILRRYKEAEEFVTLAKECVIEGQEADAERIFAEMKEGKYPMLI